MKRIPTPWWPKFLNETPDDFYFKPNRAEVKNMRLLRKRTRLLAQLEGMRVKWEREEVEHLRLRITASAAVIEAAAVKQRLEDQREERRQRRMAEIEKVKAYYEGEYAKEDEARRKKAADLAKMIAKHDSRIERQKLASKGLIRGRKR